MKKTCKWAYILLIISAILTMAINVVIAIRFNYIRMIMEFRKFGFFTVFSSVILSLMFALAFLIFAALAKNKMWASIVSLILLVLSLFMQGKGIEIIMNNSRGYFIIDFKVQERIWFILELFNYQSNPQVLASNYVRFYFVLWSLPSLALGLTGSIKLIIVQSKNKSVIGTANQEVIGSEEVSADNLQTESKEETTDTDKMRERIEFEDIIIGEKDWKEFRKQATQEELAILAIGSKFMTTGKQFFIRSLIAFLGTIISVIVGLITIQGIGLAILIGGYAVSSLIAVKLTSYSSTYSSCKRKLSKENREYVNSYFPQTAFVELIRSIIEVGLLFMTIPYRAILMFVGIIVPSAEDWCTAHGGMDGAVITLPKGYDIGGLKAVGEYYKSCKFSDALIAEGEKKEKERLAKISEYEYTDEYGVTHKTYTTDGTNFYSSPSEYSWQKDGESTDGGQTLDTSKK